MLNLNDHFSLDGLGTALKTLTVCPWPKRESEDFGSSLIWFPVIGLSLGLVLYGANLLWGLFPFTPWPGGTALLLLASDICLTRGLHFDGLADWADSVGGFFQRKKRLLIMKDTSLGAFGVLALIVALLAKWVAFERLISCGSVVWVLVVFTLSRAMMVELMTTLPYARAEEGMGQPFIAQASTRNRILSHILSMIICIPFGPFSFLLYCLGWVETKLFGLRCRYAFGGITGDLLGTTNEMVEITLLMICALLGESLFPHTGWGWVF